MLSSLILCDNNEPFLDWIVTRDKIWILCDHQQWPAQWFDWEAPKHFPKLNVPESWWNHCIWEVYSTNQWDALKTTPGANIGQQKEPKSSLQWYPEACHTTKASNVEWMEYKVLFHLPYSFGFLPTDEYFFKHLDNFLQGKCFHKQQDS